MLAVQVQYLNVQETKRHNLVTEAQGWRDLDIRETQVNETIRHNKETESLGWATLSETNRHNVVTEGLQQEANQINWKNAETNAMNAQTNRMQIPILWMNAETNRMNAETNKVEAATHKWNAEQQAAIGIRSNDLKAEANDIQRNKVFFDYVNQSSQASSAAANTDVNQMNAETNRINAETNIRNADTNEKNASTNEKNAETQRKKMWLDFTSDLLHEGSSILQSGINTAGRVEAAQQKGGK